MTLKIGQQAPDFNLKSHKQELTSLTAQRGKKVLLLTIPFAFTGT